MGTRSKILLVEDEPAILKILSIKLRVCGFDVVTARNGKDALKLVDNERPDLMLLDVIIPGIDGFQVLQRLRTNSNLPVIVFSARLDNAEKALSLGADEFLGKPFDVDDLLKRISGVLDHKK